MTQHGGSRALDPAWARVRPLVFRTVIGAVVAAGLVGIVAVLFGEFGLVAEQLLMTIVVVIVFALLSWYDADVSSRRSGAFALASVATSLYLLVAGFCKIWIVVPDQYGDSSWVVIEQFWQWVGVAIVARAALLHVHLLLTIHRRYPTPVLQAVAVGTIVVIGLLAFMLSLPLLFTGATYAPWFWRTVWVLVILDLLGTVVVPLSNALFRPRHPRPADSTGWPGSGPYAASGQYTPSAQYAAPGSSASGRFADPVNGPFGALGAPGAPGAPGFTGAQEFTGVPGFTGAQEFTGVPGFTGAHGFAGAHEFTGAPGSAGVPGLAGDPERAATPTPEPWAATPGPGSPEVADGHGGLRGGTSDEIPGSPSSTSGPSARVPDAANVAAGGAWETGTEPPGRIAEPVVTGTDGYVYAARPVTGRALAWPRYVDGTPLPALPDGSPDFSGVARG